MSGIFRFFLLLTLSFDVADDLFLVVFFFFCCCGCCCCCCLQLRCHVATQGEGESCKSNAVVCCQSIRVSGGGKKKKKKRFQQKGNYGRYCCTTFEFDKQEMVQGSRPKHFDYLRRYTVCNKYTRRLNYLSIYIISLCIYLRTTCAQFFFLCSCMICIQYVRIICICIF